LLLEAVWNGGTIGGHTFAGVADKTLCGVTLTTEQVLGGFWANIAKTTTNVKRSDIDQARMQLLQQLLAAILNNAAFGSSPPGPITIALAKDYYCNGTLQQIKGAAAAMAAFNESGDSGLFTPGVAANGKDAKNSANIAFWNSTLPRGLTINLVTSPTAAAIGSYTFTKSGGFSGTFTLDTNPATVAPSSMGFTGLGTSTNYTVTATGVPVGLLLPGAVTNIVCTKGVTSSTVTSTIGPAVVDGDYDTNDIAITVNWAGLNPVGGVVCTFTIASPP
jgi:hypothetical protein